jgi:hypothetical protein
MTKSDDDIGGEDVLLMQRAAWIVESFVVRVDRGV